MGSISRPHGLKTMSETGRFPCPLAGDRPQRSSFSESLLTLIPFLKRWRGHRRAYLPFLDNSTHPPPHLRGRRLLSSVQEQPCHQVCHSAHLPCTKKPLPCPLATTSRTTPTPMLKVAFSGWPKLWMGRSGFKFRFCHLPAV